MATELAVMNYPTFVRLMPAAHAALLALSKVVHEAGFDPLLTELVKIRVSQMNGCAFCLQYHLDKARALHAAPEKLDLLAGWRDAGVFSEREAAALAWAECLTEIGARGAPHQLAAALRAHFSQTEIVLLTVVIGTINNWNRIGVGLALPPILPERAA